MAIRLTVLSGSLQSHVFESEKDSFTIGESVECDLTFDMMTDPEIQGQQIRIARCDGRWHIHNKSVQPVFLNQSLIRDSTGLRSGDLIRLSQDGPDVLFEIAAVTPPLRCIETDAPTTSPGHGKVDRRRREVNELESPRATEAPTRSGSNTTHSNSASNGYDQVVGANRIGKAVQRRSSTRRRSNRFGTFVTLLSIPAGGIAGISIAVILLWVVWKKDPLGIIQPKANNDQQVDQSAKPTALVPFLTAESQGNKQAANQPNATEPFGIADMPRVSAGQKLIPDGDAGIQIKPFETVTVDLSTGRSLSVDLSKNIPIEFLGKIKYAKDVDTPAGVVIDSDSGLLTWEVPDRLSGQQVTIPFLVSDDAGGEAATLATVPVRIKSLSKSLELNSEWPAGVYLLMAKTLPGNLYLPLGTGCSIDANTLLTSATVSESLIEAAKRDWQIMALQSSSESEGALQPMTLDVSQIRIHRMYLDAKQQKVRKDRIIRQAYFDLATVKTDIALRSQLSLSEANEGQVDVEDFTLVGYPIAGTPVTELSSIEPALFPAKLISRITPENAGIIKGRPPVLLQFEGDLPASTFGGFFVNSQSAVVGVYTFAASLPDETESSGIVYASEILPVKTLLSDQLRSKQFWVLSDESVTEK